MSLGLGNGYDREVQHDQQASAAQREWHREPGNQELRKKADQRQIGGAHHRDAGEDEIEIFRRALARPDARNESAVLLQIVGRLLGIEDHRRIEEAEEDDAERIERHVERRAMLKRGGHRSAEHTSELPSTMS